MDTKAVITATSRAFRLLAHALAAHDPEDRVLLDARRSLERMIDEVESATLRDRASAAAARAVYGLNARASTDLRHSAYCSICGPDNPMSMGVTYESGLGTTEITAELEVRAGHEGVVGRAHGAVIAAVFEDLTAHILLAGQRVGLTRKLTVDYLAGAPAPGPIRMRAWEAGTGDRSVTVEAEARNEAGDLLATC